MKINNTFVLLHYRWLSTISIYLRSNTAYHSRELIL